MSETDMRSCGIDMSIRCRCRKQPVNEIKFTCATNLPSCYAENFTDAKALRAWHLLSMSSSLLIIRFCAVREARNSCK